MKYNSHVIFVICALILGLSFPVMSQAKSNKIPPGAPFQKLLKKINALEKKIEKLENQMSPSYLIEMEVLSGFIQIGDYGGPSWETTVTIEKDELKNTKYAAIEFVAVGVWDGTSDNLIVNGRKYSLPVSEPLVTADIPFRGKTVIPIPVGLLQEGDNTIGFEAGPIINNPTNHWDDFKFGDVVLVLNH